jgi:hypothetical protein
LMIASGSRITILPDHALSIGEHFRPRRKAARSLGEASGAFPANAAG